MPRIRLVLAALMAALVVMLLPAVALADDGSAVPERLAGVIVTTLGIVLGVTRLLTASEDALHAVLPERFRWVPAAVLLALGGLATALPGVTDWWGYASLLVGAVGVVVVAAMQGHQVKLTNPPKGTPAVVANAKPSGKPPLSAALLFLLAALGLTGCTQLRPVVNAVDAVCTLGLVDSPEVQASANDRGIPIAELAALLCSVPDVYNAWEQAHNQRRDPVAAAVREAQREGLL